MLRKKVSKNVLQKIYWRKKSWRIPFGSTCLMFGSTPDHSTLQEYSNRKLYPYFQSLTTAHRNNMLEEKWGKNGFGYQLASGFIQRCNLILCFMPGITWLCVCVCVCARARVRVCEGVRKCVCVYGVGKGYFFMPIVYTLFLQKSRHILIVFPLNAHHMCWKFDKPYSTNDYSTQG